MKDIYMVGYRVKGIKTLDKVVSLSFYRKTILMPIDTQNYNIKGIYGINGSGKSGIVTSVSILRNLLINEDYLNNPMTQKTLEEIINKKTRELSIGIDFLVELGKEGKEGKEVFLYQYEVTLKKTLSGKYSIYAEKLSYKKATSRKEETDTLLEVKDGEIILIKTDEKDMLKDLFEKKTINLLSNASMSALFVKKILLSDEVKNKDKVSFLFISLTALYILGNRIYVYMDPSDKHIDYYLKNLIEFSDDRNTDDAYIHSLFQSAYEIDRNCLNVFSTDSNIIPKAIYGNYERAVGKLQDFLRIFKSDLIGIDIDKKERGDHYVCSLNMVYDSYSINAEFESTGIKKLIRLFVYLQKMVQGGIVFIDEFDSNLHDVYLCALLEYLMEYGEGQLCFTTHNVGPMDILKKHSKSIDFLSVDHKIYPWTKNGNYSPSKLYKNGMIEGSPFNVDSIDFIGVFDSMEDEE